MAADFRKRFFVSLILTLPILALRDRAAVEVRGGNGFGAGSDVAIETADVILVRSNPLDVVNVVAIPLAAGALYARGVLLTPRPVRRGP